MTKNTFDDDFEERFKVRHGMTQTNGMLKGLKI